MRFFTQTHEDTETILSTTDEPTTCFMLLCAKSKMSLLSFNEKSNNDIFPTLVSRLIASVRLWYSD